MWGRLTYVTSTLFALAVLTRPLLGEQAAWRDPAPHRVRFVTLEPGVTLETLDWGGKGRPVVLLAGYNTAHIYDDFATKLSQDCHVYGITRRGFGASSAPDDGYGAQRSANDVLTVLERLRISKPVLVGHSFGGGDLNLIGAEHPERISGLVYLNSGEDATLGSGIWKKIGVDPAELENVRNKLPSSVRNTESEPKHASFAEYQAWQIRAHGAAMPESELRQLYSVTAHGSVAKYNVPNRVRDAIFRGSVKPDFGRIRVPALALFPGALPLEQEVARCRPQNQEERAAVERMLAINQAIAREHQEELKGVPGICVRELQAANFYIWLSNESEVLREVRSFLKQLH